MRILLKPGFNIGILTSYVLLNRLNYSHTVWGIQKTVINSGRSALKISLSRLYFIYQFSGYIVIFLDTYTLLEKGFMDVVKFFSLRCLSAIKKLQSTFVTLRPQKDFDCFFLYLESIFCFSLNLAKNTMLKSYLCNL